MFKLIAMKTKLLIIPAIVALLSACSTAYKTGQTPDDVYYSPGKTYSKAVVVSGNEYNRDSYQDNSIRMGINNYRWRTFDDDYGYNPYQYGYNSGYYYNPFYCSYPVYNYLCYPPHYYSNNYAVFYTSVVPLNNTPRTVNLSTYKSGYNNSNGNNQIRLGRSQSSRSTYNNRNTEYSRRSYSIENSANSNRSYSPSTESGSSSSRSSNSGSISRPSRSR
jgi:hypothetical protein